jgi:excisionase family DNA binding protein
MQGSSNFSSNYFSQHGKTGRVDSQIVQLVPDTQIAASSKQLWLETTLVIRKGLSHEEIFMHSKKEVADLLKISQSTLSRLLSAGDLPHYKIGRSVRFSDSQIASFLEIKEVRHEG